MSISNGIHDAVAEVARDILLFCKDIQVDKELDLLAYFFLGGGLCINQVDDFSTIQIIVDVRSNLNGGIRQVVDIEFWVASKVTVTDN